MSWEFTAKSAEELDQARKSLPDGATQTIAGELFQMTLLLEVLARMPANTPHLFFRAKQEE